jgi:1,4-alpha-glucan branching enzyme
VLGDPRHAGLQQWVSDLNRIYQEEPSLFEADFDPGGFSWIDCNDHEHSIIALTRRTLAGDDFVIAVVNFTPVPRREYRLGVPKQGDYHELLNSDADVYGGSNVGNQGIVTAEAKPSHGYDFSLSLTVPPLGFLLLKPNK